MVETAMLTKKSETSQFQQQPLAQEVLGTKQPLATSESALLNEIDRPYENVPLSSTIPASVTSLATGSTIPVSTTSTIPMETSTFSSTSMMMGETLPTTTTLPTSTFIGGGGTLPTSTLPATSSTFIGGSTLPPTTLPPATTLPPTTTTATEPNVLSKWQRRRQAKKLRKQQKKMGVTTATPVATTGATTFGGSAHIKEVDYTMHEKFYSMPVLMGQQVPVPVTATGGPKLTRKEKKAWRKREKREAAALNSSMSGMSITDRKLLHDLKHDKLGPIHPAAVQQPPIVMTTTTTTAPITTTTTVPVTTTTLPVTTSSNIVGETTPVMNI